jgi:hypothetical protein
MAVGVLVGFVFCVYGRLADFRLAEEGIAAPGSRQAPCGPAFAFGLLWIRLL